MKRLLKMMQNIKNTVIESVKVEGGPDLWESRLVLNVRPSKGQVFLCPTCGKRCEYYDEGSGVRYWRGLDLGTMKVYLKARAPRISCPGHGVIVASVPWARHGSWFTYDFEQWVTWMTLHCTHSVVSYVCRIDRKTVGPIIGRVQRDISATMPSPFDNLISIGVDETSYKKGHKYLTVVVNHDTGAVIWVAKGHGKAVLTKFFKELTVEQRASIETITGDTAQWITDCADDFCPNATRLLDPFHIVQWATNALDDVRKRLWNIERKKEAKDKKKRGRGRPKQGEEKQPSKAAKVKGSRFALLKNPEDLTDSQQVKLEMLSATNNELFRAYGLKELLRLTFKLKGEDAEQSLARWLCWAVRCRIPEFVELSKKIRRHREKILETIDSGLSNARVEAINNKIKVTVRMGYGFRNVDNLIALIMLRCSKLPVDLPGRKPTAVAA
jgi:transposase